MHTGAVGAFDRLMEVLGLADQFAIDPSQAGMGTMLTESQVVLVADELPRLFEKAPRADWLLRLREADVCAVEVLRPGEVFDEPQVRHNQMVVDVDDPCSATLEQVAPPAKFSVSQPAPPSPAPAVGERRAADTSTIPDRSSAPPLTTADDVAPARRGPCARPRCLLRRAVHVATARRSRRRRRQARDRRRRSPARA